MKRAILIGALALFTAAPLFAVRFLPAVDLPIWIWQAHVLLHFSAYSQWYDLSWVPVPNFGSLALVPLAAIFGPELGARVLMALYVCAMVASFAYLVRQLAGRPTATELLGPIFAYNIYFYWGFLSNIIGIPVLLYTWARLTRLGPTPGRRDLLALSALSTVAYLCHLVDWLPIVIYLFVLIFISRRVSWVWLVSQSIPSVFLLLYAVQRAIGNAGLSVSGFSLEYYNSVVDKLASLVAPLNLFQRLDPFQPPVPVLAASVLLLVSLVAFTVSRLNPQIKRGKGFDCAPLFYTSILLLIVAVFIPFQAIGGMTPVDQRLVFPAFIALFAVLGRNATARWQAVLAILICVATVITHGIMFVSADNQLRVVYSALQARSTSETAFTVMLEAPYGIRGGCAKTLGNAGFGVPVLMHLGYLDLVERGGGPASFQDVGALRPLPDLSFPVASEWASLVPEAAPEKLVADVKSLSQYYDQFVFLGCSEDLQSLNSIWRSDDSLVDRGTYFVILDLKDTQSGRAP